MANTWSETSYKKQANVKIEFFTAREISYFKLCGFLGEEGLTLGLENRFQNTLELAGSIFTQVQELVVGLKTAWAGIGQTITKLSGDTNTKLTDVGAKMEEAGMGKGAYVGAFGSSNIILNAPYYWQGTSPITFDVSLFQIADGEQDIMYSYQNIMEILSPDFGKSGGQVGTGGMSKDIVGVGEGPGYAMVHYFPVNGQWENDGNGQGTIIFGPCLCTKATMEIKPPYSYQYMPIVGAYRFSMQTSRILDRRAIYQLFQGSNGPLFGSPTDRGGISSLTSDLASIEKSS